ncbi:MAG: hypothetical protein ACYDA8_18195 [Deferrisomatales bacterium]
MGTSRATATRTDQDCPFHASAPGACLAALGDAASWRLHRPARCASADHDACPTFLAKVLRSLRPGPARPIGDFRDK